ncbi:MAG TPA: hypothetical protein VFY03_05240 [Woeseiaceae bacterium]|nr:hypothetical protein [Woeseiaceae bacterium]
MEERRDPRGCKTPAAVLDAMAEEARDELWAVRMERELADQLGRHPLGFEVTVSCRATICQATEYGDLEVLQHGGNQRKAKTYWDEFRDKLEASPVAEEIGRWHSFAGNFSPEPDMHVAGYVLIGVGQGASDEPAWCDDLDGRF